MKYTVLGFQQQKLIDNELTIEDALILRVIKDMYSSNRMDSIIKDNKRYIWINHKYLLEQIPIIGSLSKLKRSLKKLSEKDLLETVLINSKKGVAGKFSYIKHTSKLDTLEDYDTKGQNERIKGQNDTRLSQNERIKGQNDTRANVIMTQDQRSKWPNKDSSIKDYSIKYSKNKEEQEKNAREDVPTKLNNDTKEVNDFKKVCKCYESNFNSLISSAVAEKINYWLDEVGMEVEAIMLAIKETALNNVHNFKYVETILDNWHRSGILTEDAARLMLSQHKAAKLKNAAKGGGSSKKKKDSNKNWFYEIADSIKDDEEGFFDE